jgi:hypothetical protein
MKNHPYYPQENGQVEAINKILKNMLQHMVGVNKTFEFSTFLYTLGL